MTTLIIASIQLTLMSIVFLYMLHKWGAIKKAIIHLKKIDFIGDLSMKTSQSQKEINTLNSETIARLESLEEEMKNITNALTEMKEKCTEDSQETRKQLSSLNQQIIKQAQKSNLIHLLSIESSDLLAKIVTLFRPRNKRVISAFPPAYESKLRQVKGEMFMQDFTDGHQFLNDKRKETPLNPKKVTEFTIDKIRFVLRKGVSLDDLVNLTKGSMPKMLKKKLFSGEVLDITDKDGKSMGIDALNKYLKENHPKSISIKVGESQYKALRVSDSSGLINQSQSSNVFSKEGELVQFNIQNSSIEITDAIFDYMNTLAMATGKYFMSKINNNLTQIKNEIGDVKAWLESEEIGTLMGINEKTLFYGKLLEKELLNHEELQYAQQSLEFLDVDLTKSYFIAFSRLNHLQCVIEKKQKGKTSVASSEIVQITRAIKSLGFSLEVEYRLIDTKNVFRNQPLGITQLDDLQKKSRDLLSKTKTIHALIESKFNDINEFYFSFFNNRISLEKSNLIDQNKQVLGNWKEIRTTTDSRLNKLIQDIKRARRDIEAFQKRNLNSPNNALRLMAG